jgi:hypothetical protein
MPKGQQGSSEVDKFFDNLQAEDVQDADIFDDKPKPEGQGQQAAEDADGSGDAGSSKDANEPRKNRRHRRLETQLQQEREARIAAEARAAGRADAERTSPGSDDMPQEWVTMYGDTPESRQAWALQKKLLNDHGERIRKETVAEIEERQRKDREQADNLKTFITGELEEIEDAHDVDLTSDQPSARKARRELLDLVEKLSPKDAQGNVTGYADFEQAFTIYQERANKAPDASRQKDLASRSMTRSGDAAAAAPSKQTPGFFGWRKDLGL